MKIFFIVFGKTADKRLLSLTSDFIGRINHYVPFEMVEIPALKNTGSLTGSQQKEQEASQLKRRLKAGDHVVLLDERGTERRSVDFASWAQRLMTAGGAGRLVLVAGGPYGFAPEAYGLAHELISLSQMTFSHQMIRLLLVEQFYRAMTILKGEPYHHE